MFGQGCQSSWNRLCILKQVMKVGAWNEFETIKVVTSTLLSLVYATDDNN